MSATWEPEPQHAGETRELPDPFWWLHLLQNAAKNMKREFAMLILCTTDPRTVRNGRRDGGQEED